MGAKEPGWSSSSASSASITDGLRVGLQPTIYHL